MNDTFGEMLIGLGASACTVYCIWIILRFLAEKTDDNCGDK
jgi:hypothetical protein